MGPLSNARWLLPVALVACRSLPAEQVQEPVDLRVGVEWRVPPRQTWPTDEWPRATPEEAGLVPGAMAELEAYAFRRDGDDADRKGQRTNALLVVQGGRIVFERYARGYDADSRLLTWSVTKSMAATVVGAAVNENLVDPNAPACRYYAPMCRAGHDHVRVTDLLRMSSGLEWAETYETSPIYSSVMAMLYTRGPGDMAAFAASQPLSAWPGQRWSYSSGDTNILMAVLRGAVGEEAYADYPWKRVFDPIGMRDVAWERDAAGTFIGSSYLYATAQDLARWGYLVLNDGTWGERRILADGWVRYTTTMAPSYYSTPISHAHEEDNPGAQWYLNRGDPDRGLERPWPALPEDAFGASGHWGKYIWVIPSWDAVVVRMGDDREYGCEYDWETDCVADPEAAYTRPRFLELLAIALTPAAPPEPLPMPPPPEPPTPGGP